MLGGCPGEGSAKRWGLWEGGVPLDGGEGGAVTWEGAADGGYLYQRLWGKGLV